MIDHDGRRPKSDRLFSASWSIPGTHWPNIEKLALPQAWRQTSFPSVLKLYVQPYAR